LFILFQPTGSSAPTFGVRLRTQGPAPSPGPTKPAPPIPGTKSKFDDTIYTPVRVGAPKISKPAPPIPPRVPTPAIGARPPVPPTRVASNLPFPQRAGQTAVPGDPIFKTIQPGQIFH
jgi:hypothetical protein